MLLGEKKNTNKGKKAEAGELEEKGEKKSEGRKIPRHRYGGKE